MLVHFLFSPRAKTIRLAQVARLTKDQAETMFANIRLSAVGGAQVAKYRAIGA